MRKSVVVVLAAISVLLLGAAAVSYSKYKKSAADYAQATADQESMRQRYDQAVSEIVMIQDSLNAIVLGEDAAVSVQRDVEGQPGTLHDNVLTRIATLKGAIERTKGRIEELDARLKKNGVKIAGLQRMIAGLRKSATERESRIAELTGQVDTLKVQVVGLNTEIETQQADLTAKQHELATIFYTMGTKKELTKAGVVASNGGVLGFGKTLKPSGTFNETSFTPLDTDQENVIRIPAEKARVLSAQPVSSYTLTPISKDMMELRIVDAKEFRKIKHLVILRT
jgi:peptidoglycan hydrolase CwlO-like protein